MTPATLIIYLIAALACGFIADAIGKRKGRAGDFWLGLILGPLGVLIVAVMPASQEGKVRLAAERLKIEQEAQRLLDAEREGQP